MRGLDTGTRTWLLLPVCMEFPPLDPSDCPPPFDPSHCRSPLDSSVSFDFNESGADAAGDSADSADDALPSAL
jgi:hypothetical protein